MRAWEALVKPGTARLRFRACDRRSSGARLTYVRGQDRGGARKSVLDIGGDGFYAFHAAVLGARRVWPGGRASIAVIGHPGQRTWEFYPEDELRGDVSNWWAPTALALSGALRAAGFADVQLTTTPPPVDGVPGEIVRYRLVAVAHKHAPSLAHSRA